MLRLISTDLPTTGIQDNQAAPLLRLYDGDRHPLAPFLSFNVNARGSNTAYNPITLNLGNPDQLGSYYRITTGFSLAGIIKLVTPGAQFDRTEPFVTVPGKYWYNGNTINLHTSLKVKAGNLVTAIAIAKTTLPAPDGNDNYNISIANWNNPTITEIMVEGLQFLPVENPSNPKTSEFGIFGQTLRLYGSPEVRPAAGSEVLLLLTVSFILAERVCAIATFNLDMNYLDAIDYLGIAFTPALDALAPQPKEFLWGNKTANLFIPNEFTAGLSDRSSEQSGYLSVSGNLAYEGRI